MDIEINRIIDMVALKSGEYPDWHRHLHADADDSCEAVNLREMAEVIIEPLAIKLTLEADSQSLMDPADIRADIYRQGDWGEEYQCIYSPPGDFLRLGSLRMYDWPITLTDEYRGDDQRLRIGEGATGWMKCRPRRPWVTVTNTGTGIEIRFGDTRRRMPVTATYIRRPRYDPSTGIIHNIDPTLLLSLADAIHNS